MTAHATRMQRDADMIAVAHHLAAARDVARELRHHLAGAATGFDRSLDFANEIHLHVVSAVNFAAGLDLDLDHHLRITNDLTRTLTSDRDLDLDLDLARIVFEDTRTRAADLERDLDLDVAFVTDLRDQGSRKRPDSPAGQRQPRVAPMAKRLSGLAARLLPETDRARYAEEFRSELWELAAARIGRWGQLACAARVLAGAWATRAALRPPARRRAGP